MVEQLAQPVLSSRISPPFSTSIALASRFKQVSPHLYLPASRWHQGLKKQVCPPFLQEHRAPREGSSPVASPASPSSI